MVNNRRIPSFINQSFFIAYLLTNKSEIKNTLIKKPFTSFSISFKIKILN